MTGLWGAGGFVGSRIAKSIACEGVMHGEELSLPGRSLESLSGVIWAAGWPGSRNIDDVHRNPIRSKLQNVWEPIELAHRCAKYGLRALFLSSGCLYDGLNVEGKPWRETETPNYVNEIYHGDKWEMERGLSVFPSITIFRFRLPFDGSHHPRNTLHKLAQMPAVWDKEQSYTWIPDLVRAIEVWEAGKINGGVWHVTQSGLTSNYEMVREHLNPEVKRISGGDRPDPTMACPRSAAILDNSKIQSVVAMIPVEEAFQMAAREYLKSSG